MIYYAEVVSITDPNGGDRIKARVMPLDKHLSDAEIPFAFPDNPKFLHIKPKVGEAVLIRCADDGNPKSQRFYSGPIISQPQFMNRDDFIGGATTLLKGGIKNPSPSVDTEAAAKGALAADDDIALYSRKDSELILSDYSARLRCGARLTENSTVRFNRENPSLLSLKYFPEKLELDNEEKIAGFAAVVGDKVAILSPNGDAGVNISDMGEEITDKEIKRLLREVHVLPYGDKLVDLLCAFLKMFKSHTHKYDNLPPCPDPVSKAFDLKYGATGEEIPKKILSNSIYIN